MDKTKRTDTTKKTDRTKKKDSTAASNPPILGLGAYFSQVNSKDVFFHHELMFAIALEFQLVSRKIPQMKTNKMLFFSFDAWKSIHQNINKFLVVLNLAEVDCLRQAHDDVGIVFCSK